MFAWLSTLMLSLPHGIKFLLLNTAILVALDECSTFLLLLESGMSSASVYLDFTRTSPVGKKNRYRNTFSYYIFVVSFTIIKSIHLLILTHISVSVFLYLFLQFCLSFPFLLLLFLFLIINLLYFCATI